MNIKQAAKCTGLSPHTLRYYEKIVEEKLAEIKNNLKNIKDKLIFYSKTKYRSDMRGNYHLVYFCGSYRA